jgi:hypothetical protein
MIAANLMERIDQATASEETMTPVDVARAEHRSRREAMQRSAELAEMVAGRSTGLRIVSTPSSAERTRERIAREEAELAAQRRFEQSPEGQAKRLRKAQDEARASQRRERALNEELERERRRTRYGHGDSYSGFGFGLGVGFGLGLGF